MGFRSVCRLLVTATWHASLEGGVPGAAVSGLPMARPQRAELSIL